MKISTLPRSRAARKLGVLGSWALVTQTKADQAHQTSARARIAWPNPRHDRSATSSAVTLVRAKAKTRSQNSSIGAVRRSDLSSAGSPAKERFPRSYMSSPGRWKMISGTTQAGDTRSRNRSASAMSLVLIMSS
jgi:hypothetical protein